jgi:hypothetical protein
MYVLNPVAAAGDGVTALGLPLFGGATVEGGVTVASYGVSIANGGLRVVNDPRNGALAHKPGNAAAASDDTIIATAADAGFTGSVLRANAVSASGSAYNLLRLQSAGVDAFVVRGDGLTTIQGGGLNVVSGGVRGAGRADGLPAGEGTNAELS